MRRASLIPDLFRPKSDKKEALKQKSHGNLTKNQGFDNLSELKKYLKCVGLLFGSAMIFVILGIFIVTIHNVEEKRPDKQLGDCELDVTWIGDGNCDLQAFIEACHFDKGDCDCINQEDINIHQHTKDVLHEGIFKKFYAKSFSELGHFCITDQARNCLGKCLKTQGCYGYYYEAETQQCQLISSAVLANLNEGMQVTLKTRFIEHIEHIMTISNSDGSLNDFSTNPEISPKILYDVDWPIIGSNLPYTYSNDGKLVTAGQEFTASMNLYEGTMIDDSLPKTHIHHKYGMFAQQDGVIFLLAGINSK